MNKRILSILLCLLLVASLLVLAVPVGAAPSERIELKVVTETTSAKAGDTIAYQVVMGPVEAVGSVQMALDVPAGLTLAEGGIVDGVKEAMGFDALDFTKNSLMINGYASAADYKSESDTVLATFKFTVDAEATGVLTVGLTNIELGSCETFEVYDTDSYVVISDNVTVEGGTPEDPTAAPTEAPTDAPSTHTHTLVFVEEVPATEEADGVKAHYVCEGPEGCGKIFADGTGNVELTEADLVIPKIVPVVDPTEAPTTAPVDDPTTAPVDDPTTAPVDDPTTAPVVDPTVAPTEADTEAATEASTVAPTVQPTSKTSTKDTATKDSSTADSKSSSSPKTGDSTNMYLWMLIMLASMVGAGAVLFTAKRKGIFTK